MKEATARIRSTGRSKQPAEASSRHQWPNIRLEPSVTTAAISKSLGDNFEKPACFVDFPLLDGGFPLLVPPAKASDKNPLMVPSGAQVRPLQNCRFVILNCNLHYFWDLERQSPM